MATNTSKNTLYLICLQLFSRVITFLLNTFILRWSYPQVIGLASIRLEVVYSAILFMGREGFRLALTRFPLNNSNSSIFVAMSRIPFYMSLAYGIFIAWFNISFPPSEFASNSLIIDSYNFTILYFCIAACAECLFEPIYITMNTNSMLGYRLIFEGLVMAIKCIFIFTRILFIHGSQSDPDKLLASDIHTIGLSQLLYAIILLICYYSFHLVISKHQSWPITTKQLFNFRSTIESLFRSIYIYCSTLSDNTVIDSNSVHIPTLQLGLTFTRQSFIRQFLNQGDLIVLSSQSSLDDQAVYSIVNNYGSLIARVILQPMEESSRLYLCTEISSKSNTMDHSIKAYVMNILYFDAYLGLCFVCFGTWFTQALIYIMLGSKWALGSLVPFSLSLYCFYIPLMAVNGILESFVDSYATTSQLNNLQLWMVLSTCIYIPTSVISTRIWGAPGMIIASMFNTTLRLFYSARFMIRYWKSSHSNHTLSYPTIPLRVICLFILSFIVNGISYYYHHMDAIQSSTQSIQRIVYHIGIGCILFLSCAIMAYRYDPYLANIILSRIPYARNDNKKMH